MIEREKGKVIELAKMRKAAGVETLGTLKSLRKTFIPTLVNEGHVPIPTAMEIVGHTQVTTT